MGRAYLARGPAGPFSFYLLPPLCHSRRGWERPLRSPAATPLGWLAGEDKVHPRRLSLSLPPSFPSYSPTSPPFDLGGCPRAAVAAFCRARGHRLSRGRVLEVRLARLRLAEQAVRAGALRNARFTIACISGHRTPSSSPATCCGY
jgi:hypothetical protein